MKRLLQAITLCSLILFIFACATTQPPKTWKTRQATLSNIHNWYIEGALAIKAKGKGISAYSNWKQQGKNYNIQILGPFGGTEAMLEGSPKEVKFTSADRPTIFAPTPEKLMQQALGWQLPVSGLQNWILGLPAPGKVTSIKKDARNRLQSLEQYGWKIEYLDYTNINKIELPSKLTLSNPSLDIHIKLMINKWNLTT